MPQRAFIYSRSTPLPRLPRRTWILRSRRRAIAFALLGGVMVTLSSIVAEWLFYVEGEPPMLMMAASDVLAGLLTALLLARILHQTLERSESVAARITMIAEMNHHVRNALSMIQLSTVSVQDESALAAIRQGCDRIEWALREILATTGQARTAEPPPDSPDSAPGLDHDSPRPA